MTHVDHDGATDAIRKGMERWDEVRKASLDAIERCRAAEDKAARLEAQNDLLKQQHATLTAERDQLRVMVDEAKVHMSAFASMVLQGLDNLKLGPFKQAGGVKVPDHADILAGMARELNVDDQRPIPSFLQNGPVIKS